LRRGDIVLIAAGGDYGKPRPAVVIQSDSLDESDSVLVCLVTSTLRDAPIYRLSLQPSSESGLREPSQIMVEKIVAIRRDKCGRVIGRLADEEVIALTRMLGLMIGIAG
jgi:mRNA interferase MazF